ncbi:MAG: hypothetical protein Q8P46_02965 [Hyphomicrobiales bacterium]|nr:hypothetical protein [Hyphomicrobiales bacterium]
MYRCRNALLSATAAAALMGATAPGASAFDVVDWEWFKRVDELITINVTITKEQSPTGFVEMQKLQMFFGDVTATATMTDIENIPPAGGGFSGDFDETFVFEEGELGVLTYDDTADPDAIDPAGPFEQNGVSLEILGGTVDEGADELTPSIRVFGTLGEDGVLDAFDLPKVVNIATAVGNNQQIWANVPMELHDAQILGGHITPVDGAGEDPNALAFLIGAVLLTEVDDEFDGINVHTDIAALTILGAATGFIGSAQISATATVSGILQAYVENAATAVGNNASYTVESDNEENQYFLADLTQVAIADVSATASATDITIENYANFGENCFGGACEEGLLIKPIVSNVATAVGNNLNIRVGPPPEILPD